MLDGAPHEYKERAGACADCGNSPVNHFEHYVANTLAVWSSRSGNGVFGRATDRTFDRIEQPLFKFFAMLPFARFARDVQNATTYRSQVVWEEALRRGIEMEQLVLFGRGCDVYRARIGGTWFYFQSLPIPPEAKKPIVGWIDDKFLMKQTLQEWNVPVPAAISVTTERDAVIEFEGMTGPVVVKPRSGSRGRHTTVGVRTEADMRDAFRSAQKLCRYVVIEECLEGSVCRGTVVGGTLAGFFEARPPAVVGDGASTIADLVAAANRRKPDRVQDIVLTQEHRRFLARQGYAETSVPNAGARVPLTHRTGRLFGGYTRELLGAEHPALKQYLERAARALGAPVVGFDLIIPDPESDPDAQRWGIIEANSLPYIDLHYLPLEGAPSLVAGPVWNLWGGVCTPAQ